MATRVPREAEAELVQLREEVARLQRTCLQLTERQRADPARPQVAWLSAGGSLNAWCRLCREATRCVNIACLTFSQPQVAFALEEARGRGVRVRIVVSGFDLDASPTQGAQLERLKFCGCDVRALFGRRLHSKVLMTEREVVVGSCNFTGGSQLNVERGVALRYDSPGDLVDEVEWFDQLYRDSVPFYLGMPAAVSRRAAPLVV